MTWGTRRSATGGEVALNYCMRDHGGFEGNGHTLRLLSKLEHFSDSEGANLTRRVMLAELKYPVPFSRAVNKAVVPKLDQGGEAAKPLKAGEWKPPKCYLDCEQDVVSWILGPLSGQDRAEFESVTLVEGKHNKPKHKSFDCSIMDLADDIAYGVHDLEDAIALKLIGERAFCDLVPEASCPTFLQAVKDRDGSACGNDVYAHVVSKLFGSSKERKRFIGRLVNHFVTNIEIVEIAELSEPLIRFRAQIAAPQREFLTRYRIWWSKR